jgi:hypothetical protein
MAIILYKDGSSQEVEPKKALQLYFIMKELRPGPKEAYQYLERVERIYFNAKRMNDYSPKDLSHVRLPYND